MTTETDFCENIECFINGEFYNTICAKKTDSYTRLEFSSQSSKSAVIMMPKNSFLNFYNFILKTNVLLNRQLISD